MIGRIESYRRQDAETMLQGMREVLAAGGPTVRWDVNIKAGEAKLGSLTAFFYETETGWHPNSYDFGGRDIETLDDCRKLDEAHASIELAFRNRRQTLSR